MPHAIILTALSVEYLAVRAHLTDLQEERHPQGKIYERGKFVANSQIWEIGIAEVGAGNPGSAVEAERAITHFKPDTLLFVGIAGGIKDVEIGDVVAATEVYSYESGKSGDQFFPRPKVGKSTNTLVERAKAEARKDDWRQRLPINVASQPRVFVAPIAAGEQVVSSKQSETFQLLRDSYNDAIAVEMEGFGFLSAAFAYPDIRAIVIRGISDLVDGKNEDSPESGQEAEQIRQEKASCHASAFAFEILSKLEINAEEDEIDLSQLVEILKRSGRVNGIHARQALCISIQLDPSEIDFMEAIAPRDFATQLVFRLQESGQTSALCRLCKEIAPSVPGFKSELSSITRKLSCS